MAASSPNILVSIQMEVGEPDLQFVERVVVPIAWWIEGQKMELSDCLLKMQGVGVLKQ